MLDAAATFLILQGFSSLRSTDGASRFARTKDRCVMAIEERSDGRLTVRSERLGSPCLVLRTTCRGQDLLPALVDHVCLLDQLPV